MNKEYLINSKFSGIKAHPFHLVDRSPWPFFVSFGVLGLTFGGVLYMHSYVYGGYILLGSFIYVGFIVSLWWRDVVREATFQGHHTRAVKYGLRLGMKLFILSEVFFFYCIFLGIFCKFISSFGEYWCYLASSGN